MLTQPSHCCCCFSLRAGTLILATVDLIGYALALGLFSIAGIYEAKSGVIYVSIAVYAVFTLLSAVFLYGAAKRKYNIVKYLSTFIAIQIFYFVIEKVVFIVKSVTSTLPECSLNEKSNCRTESSIIIALNLVFIAIFLPIDVSNPPTFD
ncbi:hypothetical protein DSO57_1000948 [Entomophthora muscae]|uniref:Uncharacterized protein n=1 Tax=Entomophthora muscae TaxID=34485 RepID=A0ACC2TK31_9FUNG|nr:hypothetical protein DSO57_1000948 [Entomophthora muscae]